MLFTRTLRFRQCAALFSVCVLMLFIGMTQVNAVDNLKHLSNADHHDHSVLSIVDDHGHHPQHEGEGSDTDSDATEHFHPNLCGSALLAASCPQQASVIPTLSMAIAWTQPDDPPDYLTFALERPPKVYSSLI